MASREAIFPPSCCQLLLLLPPVLVPAASESCRMAAPVSSEGTQHSWLPPHAAVALSVGRSTRHLAPSRAMSTGMQYPCTTKHRDHACLAPVHHLGQKRLMTAGGLQSNCCWHAVLQRSGAISNQIMLLSCSEVQKPCRAVKTIDNSTSTMRCPCMQQQYSAWLSPKQLLLVRNTPAQPRIAETRAIILCLILAFEIGQMLMGKWGLEADHRPGMLFSYWRCAIQTCAC